MLRHRRRRHHRVLVNLEHAAEQRSDGAAAQATRQPVIACDLEKPPSVIVRSFIPGSEAIGVCTAPP